MIGCVVKVDWEFRCKIAHREGEGITCLRPAAIAGLARLMVARLTVIDVMVASATLVIAMVRGAMVCGTLLVGAIDHV
jgi:hypothetical protein